MLTLCIGISSPVSSRATTFSWNTTDLHNKASNILTNAQHYITKKVGELASKDALVLAGLAGAGLLGILFYYNQQQKEQRQIALLKSVYEDEYWKTIAQKMKNKEIKLDEIPDTVKTFMNDLKTDNLLSPEEKALRLGVLRDILLTYHHGQAIAAEQFQKKIENQPSSSPTDPVITFQ